MKKLAFILSVAGMVTLVACGQGTDQKAAADKKKADSITAQHRADSLDQVSKKQMMEDSIKAAQMKAKGDSAKPADAANKAQ